jgi:hypothetical protein
MKTLANRIVMFAASAVLLGTMAYGQEHMRAEIPFAFNAADAPLPAGNYEFDSPTIHGSGTTIRVLNSDSHKVVIVLSLPLDPYHKAADVPTANFVCQRGTCQLNSIRTYAGTYQYPATHKSGRDKESLSLLTIKLAEVNGR